MAAHPTVQTSAPEQSSIYLRPKADSSGIFVLVAEDNTINRIICTRFLQRLGHAVATVCDGQEALDYLCKTSGNRQPNIVFMDTSMPVLDGYEATRRIRNDAAMFDDRMRQVPIVGMTAHAILAVREKCLDAGMDGYISPPVRLRDLHEAVLKWISPIGP